MHNRIDIFNVSTPSGPYKSAPTSRSCLSRVPVSRLNMILPALLLGGAVAALLVPTSEGHGYMVDPPGRASMWRENWDTPINYGDNQLFCGGFKVSYVRENMCI